MRRASRLYKSDEEPNLPFIIYQNEDDLDINYLEWTVTLYIGSNVSESFIILKERSIFL